MELGFVKHVDIIDIVILVIFDLMISDSGTENLKTNQTHDKHKGWASSGSADWLRAGGGVLLLPQLAPPYLLSSALSWVTT